jgi:triacylglycerol lipase
MHVVMVHGFLDTGRLFRVFANNLRAEGHVCHVPTLRPRDGRLGIPDLSAKLAAHIDTNVPADSPLALVGFSMGAIVARHYLQDGGLARPVKAFFSIAGPHSGTPSAYLYPGMGTRQMRPSSEFLKGLDCGVRALGAIPVYTYRTPFDLMVLPPRASRIPAGKEVVVWCPLHSMLPGDSAVMAHIADALAALDPSCGCRRAPSGASIGNGRQI